MNNPTDTLAALAPCPFCGSHRVARQGRCIECFDCHASGPERTQRDECERAWNRRASLKGEAVAWMIEWNNPEWRGIRSVSLDRCHPDDGTCRPLIYGDTITPDPQAVGEGGRVTSGMICDALGVPRGYALMIAWVEQETGSAHGRWLAHLPAAAEQITAAISTHPTPSPAPQGGGEAAVEATEAPHPDYIEHIQFEGCDRVVLSPEAYGALYELALATPPAQQPGEVGEDAIFAAARKYSTTGQDARMRQTFEFDDHGLREFVAALAPKEKGNG